MENVKVVKSGRQINKLIDMRSGNLRNIQNMSALRQNLQGI